MFRLCLHLGVPHPDHLEQILTPRQVRDWQRFWRVEPFGSPAEDQRSAHAVWASLLPHAKDKSKTPDDYLIRWTEPAPLTTAELIAKTKAALGRSAPRT